MTDDARQGLLNQYLAARTLENRNAVVAAHRYLCRRGARKFFRGTVERADLEQIAAIGLIKACERYNRDYQTPFEAYAWLMIVGELMHFVRDHEHVIRIPRQLRSLERRYRDACERLTARLNREPSARELASELGTAIETIDEIRILRAHKLADDEDEHAATSGSYTISFLPTEGMVDVDDHITLANALRQLNDRERHILRQIFFRRFTQAEVGRELGISQRQVSRVLTRTLQRLASMIAA